MIYFYNPEMFFPEQATGHGVSWPGLGPAKTFYVTYEWFTDSISLDQESPSRTRLISIMPEGSLELNLRSLCRSFRCGKERLLFKTEHSCNEV